MTNKDHLETLCANSSGYRVLFFIIYVL